MNKGLNDEGLDLLFREARTHGVWLDKPVADETLRQLYDLLKMRPTSANSCPARFLFLRAKEAKERLRPALAAGNVEKTMTAPVTVIVAYDLKFYEKLPKLFPHNPRMRDMFANSPELVEVTAKRNSSLQGAYLMMAARAWSRLRPHVRLRQCQSGRRILRHRQRTDPLRSGVLLRRQLEVELPVQPWIRRSHQTLPAQSASQFRGSVQSLVMPPSTIAQE